MSRDEMIDGGIRVLGVYFFCNGVAAFVNTLDVLYNAIDIPRHAGLSVVLKSSVYFASHLALGWYLMRGGALFKRMIGTEHADCAVKAQLL